MITVLTWHHLKTIIFLFLRKHCLRAIMTDNVDYVGTLLNCKGYHRWGISKGTEDAERNWDVEGKEPENPWQHQQYTGNWVYIQCYGREQGPGSFFPDSSHCKADLLPQVFRKKDRESSHRHDRYSIYIILLAIDYVFLAFSKLQRIYRAINEAMAYMKPSTMHTRWKHNNELFMKRRK